MLLILFRQKRFNVGVASIGSTGRVESANPRFLDTVKVDDLLTYSDLTTSTDKIMVKVETVDTDSITVQGVETVAGVVNGSFLQQVLSMLLT